MLKCLMFRRKNFWRSFSSSSLVPPPSWSLNELQLHNTSNNIINDSNINDLCKLACIDISSNQSIKKDIILDVNTILRCSQAIEIEKKQLQRLQNEVKSPYFHPPLQYPLLRKDILEEDSGISQYLEDNKDRMVDQYFTVPKLKTDSNVI